MRLNPCPLYDAEDLRQIADAEGEGMWFKGASEPTWESAHAEAFNAGRAISYPATRYTLEATPCSN